MLLSLSSLLMLLCTSTMTTISKTRPMRLVQALVLLGIALCMFHTGIQLSRLEFGRVTEPSAYHFGLDLFLSFNSNNGRKHQPQEKEQGGLVATTRHNNHNNNMGHPINNNAKNNNNNNAKNAHHVPMGDESEYSDASTRLHRRDSERTAVATTTRDRRTPPQNISPDELAKMKQHSMAYAARQKALRKQQQQGRNNDQSASADNDDVTNNIKSNKNERSPPTRPTQSSKQILLEEVGGLESKKKATALSRAEKLLLNTPFYVYEELHWLNEATVGNMSAAAWIQNEMEIKHTDDWWFAKASMRHPMRVNDPANAKLFVVPALLNMAVDQIINYSNDWDNYTPEWRFHAYNTKLCINNDTICNVQLIEHVNRFLHDSPWFQRHDGRDHVIVASHWASEWVIPRYNNLASCNVIGWEKGKWNRLDREMMPSLYVGNGCKTVVPIPKLQQQQQQQQQQLASLIASSIAEHKTDDFAMIGSLRNRPAFKNRRQICKWMNTTTKGQIRMTHCGQGKQCPALAKAKFGFHARGDTWGSNRLMDTLLSGTVPVFTAMEQYDMLPDWIDWNLISNFANISQRHVFMRDVRNMAKNTKAWENKMQHVLLNRDLFDWKTLVPFDVYLYQLSVQLWPTAEWERREKHPISTPFTALKLPTISSSRTTSTSAQQNPSRNNNSNAAVATVALESFQAFTQSKEAGSTNCGDINDYVNSCDQCSVGSENGCFGGCMWCEHGSLQVGSEYLWSSDNRNRSRVPGKQQQQQQQQRPQQCVHRSQRCRPGPPSRIKTTKTAAKLVSTTTARAK